MRQRSGIPGDAPARFAAIVALAAVGVGCGPLAPAQPRAAEGNELLVYLGGTLQRLQRRDAVVEAPAQPVSIRGKTVLPAHALGGDRNQPFVVDELPHFPKVLVIVTVDELARRSQVLPEYIRWKQASGWRVVVGTEAAWNRVTADDGDDRPARIRAWLRQIYDLENPGYLLLIGDPTPEHRGVPMRRTEPLANLLPYYPPALAGLLDHVPTDQYYADLESSWDCDGDGQFGEQPDDMGDGCADFGPELIVGRIPVYHGAAELDAILRYTIDQEQAADRRYRDRALFAGAFGGFQGQDSPAGDGSTYPANDDLAVFLHRTADDLPLSKGLQPIRLFEEAGIVPSGLPHEQPLTRGALVAAWQQGAATVAWGGHGGNDGAYRTVWLDDGNDNQAADYDEVDMPPFITTADAEALAGAPGAFVHMMSCLNGYPEDAGNLGTALLGRGALATASASRAAIGDGGAGWQPRPELASATDASYYFVLAAQSGQAVGDALAFTKWALPGDGWNEYEMGDGPRGLDSGFDLNAYAWLTKLEYNLYGDPTLRIERCVHDADCDDALPCNGREACRAGHCLHLDPVVCPTAGDAPCLTSACDNTSGQCTPLPVVDGMPCDDSAWCTVDDACRAGTCRGSSRSCSGHPGYQAQCDEQRDECTLVSTEAAMDDDDNSERAAGCSATHGPRPSATWIWIIVLGGAARSARRGRQREERP